jgi:hypothetical protein
VHEKPYELGTHPVTDGSCSHVLPLAVVVFVKQQYSSSLAPAVGTLQTSVASLWSGGAAPIAQL